jgi:Domain of unknown function (DUF4149)
MTFLRFLMLLALAVWLGALIFFPVVAQTSFAVLPSTHLAGLVVRGSLLTLHWMALISGTVFLASSLIYNRAMLGQSRVLSLSHVLVLAMLALTSISQFHIIPRMDTFRTSAGEMASLAADNPMVQQFDSLHAWSTRLEGAVLLLGLIVLYSTARRFGSSQA